MIPEEEVTEPGIFEPSVCPNPAIDAIRSVFSAAGKEITCDKAKGILLLAGAAIVGIIVLKFFVLKK